MEGSPLGNAFGDSAGRKKSRKSFLLIAVAAALGLGGTVLASNITINSDTDIEFGQGVAQTAACDNAMTITPFSAYDEGDEVFYLTTVEVTDIDGSSCDNRGFTVSVYASGTANPVATKSTTYDHDNDSEELSFDFTLDEVDTADVNTITVETNN